MSEVRLDLVVAGPCAPQLHVNVFESVLMSIALAVKHNDEPL
jgi:hypothetical protein